MRKHLVDNKRARLTGGGADSRSYLEIRDSDLHAPISPTRVEHHVSTKGQDRDFIQALPGGLWRVAIHSHTVYGLKR